MINFAAPSEPKQAPKTPKELMQVEINSALIYFKSIKTENRTYSFEDLAWLFTHLSRVIKFEESSGMLGLDKAELSCFRPLISVLEEKVSSTTPIIRDMFIRFLSDLTEEEVLKLKGEATSKQEDSLPTTDGSKDGGEFGLEKAYELVDCSASYFTNNADKFMPLEMLMMMDKANKKLAERYINLRAWGMLVDDLITELSVDY